MDTEDLVMKERKTVYTFDKVKTELTTVDTLWITWNTSNPFEGLPLEVARGACQSLAGPTPEIVFTRATG